MDKSRISPIDDTNDVATSDTAANTEALERRAFLKKLGKYSAVTSVTTVTMMTANKVSAISPPPPPSGGF